MTTTNQINKSEIFFVSDTHFGHANIIKYCNRPFNNTDEMDEALINNWNAKVPKDGIVYHLGDFAWGSINYWEKIREQLNGEIILIYGNHDEKYLNNEHMYKLFKEVTPQKKIWIDKTCIYMNHYPFLCFGGSYKGLGATWQLFGHVHSNSRSEKGLDHKRLVNCFPTQYDVGVDNNNFTPISFDEVSKIITNQQLSLGMYDKDNESLVE